MLRLGVLPPWQRPPKFKGRAVLEALEVVLRAVGGVQRKSPPTGVCCRRCCWHLVLHEGSWSHVKRPEYVSCQALRSSQTLLHLCLTTKRFVKRQ